MDSDSKIIRLGIIAWFIFWAVLLIGGVICLWVADHHVVDYEKINRDNLTTHYVDVSGYCPGCKDHP